MSDAPQLPQPPQTPQPSQKPPQDGGAVHRGSTGERLFDLGVYGGLGYLANAAVSLAITRYAVQKKGTRLFRFGQHTQARFEQLFERFISDPQQIQQWGRLSNDVLFLGSGGWLMVLPMKWLEDHKPELVQRIDETLGTGPQTQQERDAQQAYFDNQPRQSFLSLLGGRAFAYVATIAAALPFITETTGINAGLNHFLNKQLGPHLGELREPLMLMHGRETHIPAFVDALSKETILAGTAAGVHYGSSKLIALGKHRLTHGRDDSLASDPATTDMTDATPENAVRHAAAAGRLQAPPDARRNV